MSSARKMVVNRCIVSGCVERGGQRTATVRPQRKVDAGVSVLRHYESSSAAAMATATPRLMNINARLRPDAFDAASGLGQRDARVGTEGG